MMAYYVEHGPHQVPEVVVLDDRGYELAGRAVLDGGGAEKWNGLLEQEGFALLSEWHPDPHGVGELRVRVQRVMA
jgi:hypothetical protein